MFPVVDAFLVSGLVINLCFIVCSSAVQELLSLISITCQMYKRFPFHKLYDCL
jgi:hypothetical protein